MRRVSGVLFLSSTMRAPRYSGAYATVPEKVRDDPRVDERSAAASPDYFAWSQNLPSNSNLFNSYVRPSGGGPRVRVNPAGTRSWTVGIDGSLVVYQEDSSLAFYDAATQTRDPMPDGVNTRSIEEGPSLSGDWLLFTRDNRNRVTFESSRTWVILFNLVTGESRVLRSDLNRRALIGADQVNGDWATFDRCHVNQSTGDQSNCDVFRYRISTQTLVRIANPGRQQYGGAISQDGTVYLVRTGGPNVWHCGLNTRIVRYPVGGPGVVIAEIGSDAFTTRATDETDSSTVLYVLEARCSPYRSGIYRIPNANTAT